MCRLPLHRPTTILSTIPITATRMAMVILGTVPSQSASVLVTTAVITVEAILMVTAAITTVVAVTVGMVVVVAMVAVATTEHN